MRGPAGQEGEPPRDRAEGGREGAREEKQRKAGFAWFLEIRAASFEVSRAASRRRRCAKQHGPRGWTVTR